MRQRLGQHFLRDGKVIQTILASAELSRTDTVLEIGPGKGVLTYALAARARRLVAVELDLALVETLRERLPDRAKAEVFHSDILKADLDALFPAAVRPIKVLGNLPYAITSPIFEKLLAWPGWETGVFLIQREVAERIASAPGSRSFGILSLAVQVLAEPEIVMRVKPGAFSPPPEVESSVLRLRRRGQPGVRQELLPAFFDFAHGAFAHRRKTLANSLSLFSGISKPAVERWIRSQELSPTVRAESLGLEEYARLAEPWAIFRREINLT